MKHHMIKFTLENFLKSLKISVYTQYLFEYTYSDFHLLLHTITMVQDFTTLHLAQSGYYIIWRMSYE